MTDILLIILILIMCSRFDRVLENQGAMLEKLKRIHYVESRIDNTNALLLKIYRTISDNPDC